MNKLIVFNWKMNPETLKGAIDLAKASDYEGVIIAPPFIFIEEIAKILKKAKVGAQDLSWENPLFSKGAFTGEISAKELKNLGVEYVIVGHSERRQKLNETDEMINKKILAALKASLKVVLCVGEDLAIRKKGKKAVKNYIKNQLQKDLKGIIKSLPRSSSNSLLRGYKLKAKSLIVAYEPVWAIGTGHSDTPQDAYHMIEFIKENLRKKYKILNPIVIYGGSVNSKNIKDFVKYLPRSDAKHLLRGKEIDGFLVGGASLKPTEIKKIIKIIM